MIRASRGPYPYRLFPRVSLIELKYWGIRPGRASRYGTRDPMPTRMAPCCIHCGTWVCMECGGKRHLANRSRSSFQICFNCGGEEGYFYAVRHRRDHEPPPQVPFRVPLLSRKD